ncbi:hypothetical protein Ancab_016917 [Ancistrocladus abbreviatus]
MGIKAHLGRNLAVKNKLKSSCSKSSNEKSVGLFRPSIFGAEKVHVHGSLDKLRVSISKGRKVNNNNENRRLPFHDNRSYADVVRQPPGKLQTKCEFGGNASPLQTNYELGGKASSRIDRGRIGQEFKGLAFPTMEKIWSGLTGVLWAKHMTSER